MPPEETPPDEAPDSPAAQAEPQDPVASIGEQLPRLSTGDRAALRRTFLTNSAQAQGVLIGLLHRAALPDGAWRGPAALQRWRLLAHVAATLSGTAGINPHAPGQRLGRALHAAGYSENRLMRLTTARGPALIDQVVRAARYLAQGGQTPVDLRPIRALTSDDPERAERARIEIARDYFAAKFAQERKAQ